MAPRGAKTPGASTANRASRPAGGLASAVAAVGILRPAGASTRNRQGRLSHRVWAWLLLLSGHGAPDPGPVIDRLIARHRLARIGSKPHPSRSTHRRRVY